MLEIKNLTKKFGGLAAVNNVDMHVNKGEIVGLIGANGAGKTTLFNMVAGAFSATSGKILFEGKAIQGMPSHKICRLGIARTYQIVKPFRNLSMLDNTTVGALHRHHNVADAKKKAEEICRFLDMEPRMHVPGSALNLPELKRMELARALATEPKLLLLDEVMAGLHPADSAKVIEVVKKIGESGVTVVVIEHVMKAIMTLSERIYVLNHGIMIAEGTPKEIGENENVIKAYLGEKRYAKN